jgi:hypothetical protein
MKGEESIESLSYRGEHITRHLNNQENFPLFIERKVISPFSILLRNKARGMAQVIECLPWVQSHVLEREREREKPQTTKGVPFNGDWSCLQSQCKVFVVPILI